MLRYFLRVMCCSMKDCPVSGVEGCFFWIEILVVVVGHVDDVLDAYAGKLVPGSNQVDW